MRTNSKLPIDHTACTTYLDPVTILAAIVSIGVLEAEGHLGKSISSGGGYVGLLLFCRLVGGSRNPVVLVAQPTW